jgi:hypothetical protein
LRAGRRTGCGRALSGVVIEGRQRREVLFQVDQELAEGPRLGVAPELTDPRCTVKTRQHQDVEDKAARAVVFGLLREMGLPPHGEPAV